MRPPTGRTARRRRLGVDDDPRDRRVAVAQEPLQIVDPAVHALHGRRRIEAAMGDKHITAAAAAHPHVVNVGEPRDATRGIFQRRDVAPPQRLRGILDVAHLGLERLDVDLDLGRGAEFPADRGLEPVGDLVGGGER